MDLRQMRREAVDYYNRSNQEVQNLTYQFFRVMDTNGDVGVDFMEIQRFLQGRTFMSRFLNGQVFRQLDTDGNGTLDFHEFITLFYMIFMCFNCDGCGVPLRECRHLTCVTCFTSANNTGNTFDLCGSCYARGSFRHGHRDLVDYQTLILGDGGETTSRSAPGNIVQPRTQGNHGQGSTTHRSVNYSGQMTTKKAENIFGHLCVAIQTAASVSSLASMGSSCSIL